MSLESIPLSRIYVLLIESLKSIYFKQLPASLTISSQNLIIRIIYLPLDRKTIRQPICHHTTRSLSSQRRPIAHRQSILKSPQNRLAKYHQHLQPSHRLHVHSSVLLPSVCASAQEAVRGQTHLESEPNHP